MNQNTSCLLVTIYPVVFLDWVILFMSLGLHSKLVRAIDPSFVKSIASTHSHLLRRVHAVASLVQHARVELVHMLRCQNLRVISHLIGLRSVTLTLSARNQVVPLHLVKILNKFPDIRSSNIFRWLHFCVHIKGSGIIIKLTHKWPEWMFITFS